MTQENELIKYITSWLAYYNHRQMFDGMVPMNTARLMVESSIDDELRKQARDLAEHVTPLISAEARKQVVESFIRPNVHAWKNEDEKERLILAIEDEIVALKEGGKEAE